MLMFDKSFKDENAIEYPNDLQFLMNAHVKDKLIGITALRTVFIHPFI